MLHSVFYPVSRNSFEIVTACQIFQQFALKVLYTVHLIKILSMQLGYSINSLKLSSLRLSAVFCLRIVSVDTPAVIRYHINIPSSLVPALHLTYSDGSARLVLRCTILNLLESNPDESLGSAS